VIRSLCGSDEVEIMKMICYCFGYTEADIIADVLNHHRRSTILERVAEARRTLTCQCDDKHPEKR
jgi:hypothetical protein